MFDSVLDLFGKLEFDMIKLIAGKNLIYNSQQESGENALIVLHAELVGFGCNLYFKFCLYFSTWLPKSGEFIV